MPRLFIAVDGGATKTFSAVYNGDLQVVGIGVDGPSNYRNVGEATAVQSIDASVRKAISMSRISAENIAHTSYAIAGVKDSDKSTQIVDGLVSKSRMKCQYSLYNDAEAGFFSRFLDKDGIIVAPGTGMIAYSRFKNRMERASGWGWFIGDEGGAFSIGRTALNRFSRMSDGREMHDQIFERAIKEEFSVSRDRDIVNKVYKEHIEIRRIAAIAAIIAALSEEGDATAAEILKNAANDVARSGIALYNRLNIDAPMCFSGYGGVFRSGRLYWDTIKNTIRKSVKKSRFKLPIYGYHAVIGSILMHAKAEGFDIQDPDIDRLKSQIDDLIPAIPERDRKDYLFMNP